MQDELAAGFVGSRLPDLRCSALGFGAKVTSRSTSHILGQSEQHQGAFALWIAPSEGANPAYPDFDDTQNAGSLKT